MSQQQEPYLLSDHLSQVTEVELVAFHCKEYLGSLDDMLQFLSPGDSRS